jgi:hypothetical protein
MQYHKLEIAHIRLKDITNKKLKHIRFITILCFVTAMPEVATAHLH